MSKSEQTYGHTGLKQTFLVRCCLINGLQELHGEEAGYLNTQVISPLENMSNSQASDH